MNVLNFMYFNFCCEIYVIRIFDLYLVVVFNFEVVEKFVIFFLNFKRRENGIFVFNFKNFKKVFYFILCIFFGNKFFDEYRSL